MAGHGCKQCGDSVNKSNTDEFITKAKQIHDNRYLYTDTVYKSAKEKLIITCQKHGNFLQWPSFHLRGRGCQKCKQTIGEKLIENYLTHENIIFENQYKIADCKNKKPLPFDFAIFDKDNNLKYLIEYQGEQHFHITKRINKEIFEIQLIRDQIKRDYCKEHNIRLLEIPYWEQKNIDSILYKELVGIK